MHGTPMDVVPIQGVERKGWEGREPPLQASILCCSNAAGELIKGLLMCCKAWGEGDGVGVDAGEESSIWSNAGREEERCGYIGWGMQGETWCCVVGKHGQVCIVCGARAR